MLGSYTGDHRPWPGVAYLNSILARPAARVAYNAFTDPVNIRWAQDAANRVYERLNNRTASAGPPTRSGSMRTIVGTTAPAYLSYKKRSRFMKGPGSYRKKKFRRMKRNVHRRNVYHPAHKLVVTGRKPAVLEKSFRMKNVRLFSMEKLGDVVAPQGDFINLGFQINNMFELDPSRTAWQPIGFDLVAKNFTRYVVTGIQFTYWIASRAPMEYAIEDTDPGTSGASQRYDFGPAAPGTIDRWLHISQARSKNPTKYKMVINNAGQDMFEQGGVNRDHNNMRTRWTKLKWTTWPWTQLGITKHEYLAGMSGEQGIPGGWTGIISNTDPAPVPPATAPAIVSQVLPPTTLLGHRLTLHNLSGSKINVLVRYNIKVKVMFTVPTQVDVSH